MPDTTVLAINAGSSSLKFGVYLTRNGDEEIQLDGLADGVGRDSGKLQIKDASGRVLKSEAVRLTSAAEALAHAKSWLAELSPAATLRRRPPRRAWRSQTYRAPKNYA